MKLNRGDSMLSRVILLPAILFLLCLLFLGVRKMSQQVQATELQQPNAPAATTTSVLVELFTSEGCSTCPPADKLLTDLDENQPIRGVRVIALSEHVDYWNRLGWKDPFSSAQFTQRQTDYSKTLGNEDIYTPQMVVDGRTEFVGSQRAKALEAIIAAAQSPRAKVETSIKTNTPTSITFRVKVSDLPNVARGDKADVMLAITEGGLMSNVLRGENSGRRLTHSAVTRKLTRIGSVEGNIFSGESVLTLNSIWKRDKLRAVVFVQERTSHVILGAAEIKLEGGS